MLLLSIFAVLAAYVPADRFWIMPFFGFLIPVLVPVNLFFILLWIQRKRFFRALLSSLIIILAIPQIKAGVAFNNNNKNLTQEEYFKFINFNVRLFDLYNWSKNIETRNKIFTYLKEQDPDVIAFQEYFYSSKQNYFVTRDSLVKILNMPYFAEAFDVISGHGHYGVAIFSKFPIVNKQFVDFPGANGNNGLFADLVIKNDTIRVFCGHLASISFHGPDYDLVKKILNQPEKENLNAGLKLLEKIKNANERRILHSKIVRSIAENSPHPTILALDMNDTPFSHSYFFIKGYLKDAFLESGRGFGQSYVGPFPSYRIDYILHSSTLESKNFTTDNIVLSDHKPLITYFRVKQ